MIIYEEIFKSLSKQYIVNDINVEKAKVIFILESPHIQELKYKVPVAGSSGATMAKQLFNVKTPLGLLLNSGHLEFAEIGLMNVCQIPMQRLAYDNKDLKLGENLLKNFEAIRSKNQTEQYKDDELNIVQKLILKNFILRLVKLEERSCILIPCGKFAQKFLNIALRSVNGSTWEVIDDVPHPSYNSWSREKYKVQVEKVKNAVQKVNC